MTDHHRGGAYGEAGLAGRRSGPGSGLGGSPGVERTTERKELRVELARAGGGRLRCPHCGEACPGYDTRRREWRNLDAWGYSTFLVCDVPRMRCREHGVVTDAGAVGGGQFEVIRQSSRRSDPVAEGGERAGGGAAERLSWNAADGIMQRAVARGLARRPGRRCGTCRWTRRPFRRRHQYVTVVSNPRRDRAVCGTGRGKQALKAFYEGLGKAAAPRSRVSPWTCGSVHRGHAGDDSGSVEEDRVRSVPCGQAPRRRGGQGAARGAPGAREGGKRNPHGVEVPVAGRAAGERRTGRSCVRQAARRHAAHGRGLGAEGSGSEPLGATRAGPGRSPDGTGGSTGRRAAAWTRSSKPPRMVASTSGASSTP